MLNILLVAMIGLAGAGPQRQISCAECKHEMHHFGSKPFTLNISDFIVLEGNSCLR